MALLLRNWPLKLGALVLSVLLYAGLVYSGSFTEQQVTGVPIRAVNQPLNTYLLTGDLGTVDIGYRASAAAAGGVTASTFSASVDLEAYDMTQAGEPQLLAVEVRSLDDEVEVLDTAPLEVSVILDRLGVRTVQVVVDRGEIPAGLEITSQDVMPSTVQAQGPESRLRLVTRALARVRIDPSGIDVHEQVDLVAVNVDGEPVPAVELSPNAASVDIEVSTAETSKTVPVALDLQGSPPVGLTLTAISAEPAAVTLFGPPEVLAAIASVSTEPIDLGTVSADDVIEVALIVSDQTRLGDGVEPVASVSVDVSLELASRTILAGPVCTNVGAGLSCEPATAQIPVTVSGTRSAVTALTPAQVTPILNMAGLGAGTHQVTPTVNLPAGITLVQALGPVAVTLTAGGP
ncbi:MAG TPA: CdaR family protein [Candidatus Limnocylindria bacterium]|nr:CdaR family protein [Candidatus Limnocylindria bacterium]